MKLLFTECLKVTERVLSRHERGVHDAVRDVLERLVQLRSFIIYRRLFIIHTKRWILFDNVFPVLGVTVR